MEIVINEVYADAPGADEGQEWVELYNSGGEAVALDGWAVWSGTSALAERVVLAGTLEPAGYLVVGGPELTLGNAGTSADAVALHDATGAVVDTVVYGAPNSDIFVDDRGEVAWSTAPAPVSGLSLMRSPDGRDTDDSGVDFLNGEPTPGAANPVPLPCVPSTDIVINELLPDPPGDDGEREWVELYNAGEHDVALGGWTLTFATSAYSEPDVVLGDVVLAAGAFLVVGGAEAGADVVTGAHPGNGTETDAVRLTSCDGTYTDTVLYGEAPNGDELDDDRGETSEPYGEPSSGQSIARWVDGVDSDRSADWRILVVPTPGAPNPAPSGAEEEDNSRGCTARPGAGCRSRPTLAVFAALVPWWRRRYLLARAISSTSTVSTC